MINDWLNAKVFETHGYGSTSHFLDFMRLKNLNYYPSNPLQSERFVLPEELLTLIILESKNE